MLVSKNSLQTPSVVVTALLNLLSTVGIRESELHEAYCHEQMAKRCGYPPYMMHRGITVDGIVEEVSFKCVDKILGTAKAFVRVDVDRESRYPEIIVRGSLLIGVNKNEERT